MQVGLTALRLLILVGLAGGDHASWWKTGEMQAIASRYQMVIVSPAAGTSWYIDSLVNPS